MYKIVTYPVRELFERVWTTPVLQLAREIGVSDVALSKACRKAGILLPRRGHWGKTIEKRPKRPTPPDSAESITFRVLDRSVFPPAPPKAPGRPHSSKLNVPTKLTDPHPLVREWLQAVRVAEDFEGRVELRRVRVLYTRISRDMVDRAALLLDTLIKDAEKKGCSWAVDDHNRTTVTFDGETVYVTLRERVTKAVKPPPPEQKHKRHRTREPVLWLGPREIYLYSSTGEFTLIAQEMPDLGSQSSWTDSKTGQLENKLHLFCNGLSKLIGRMRAYRASIEASRREYEESARIRREALMAAAHQRNLQRRLLEDMERWEKSKRLREFIDAVAADSICGGEEKGSQTSAWVEWARAQVDLIDPVGNPATTSLEPWDELVPEYPARK